MKLQHFGNRLISLIFHCYLQIKLIPPPPDSDKQDSTKAAEGDQSDKDSEKQAEGENSEEEEKKSENITEDKEDEDEKKGDERDEQDETKEDKDSKDETAKNKESDDPTEENTPKEYFFLLNDWVKVTEDVDCWREIPVTMETPEDILPGKSYGDMA